VGLKIKKSGESKSGITDKDMEITLSARYKVYLQVRIVRVVRMMM
jgi:hypothetical protein